MTLSRKCPICRRPVPEDFAHREFRPFCSKRCADIDLGRWLKGVYAIPAVESEEGEADGSNRESDEGAGA